VKLIIGLGNPGEEYAKTRHNVGFMALDGFIEQNNCSLFGENKKFEALISQNKIFDEEVIFIKPLTYMNNSGKAVAALVNFYKINLEKDLMVIYDDVDLEIGKIRVRNEGSAGTHNGMRSILEFLGNKNFYRVRIGTESRGKYAPEKQDLHSFVLTNFSQEEREILEKVLGGVSIEVGNFIKAEINLAFSKSFV